MRRRRRIITSTPRPASRSGSFPRSSMRGCRPTSAPSKPPHSPGSTSTSTSPRSSSRRKPKNTSPSLKRTNDLPANKSKLLSPITIPTKREMKSTTSGIASTFARRTRRTKRLPSPGATPNSTLATPLPTSSMKREAPTTASSSPEGAAPMESIADIITRYHALKIASASTRPRTSSEEHALAPLDRT